MHYANKTHSAVMAGSYSYDLTIERADVLSLIHHCMGPAMLLWIRCSFSTYTPADATMNRLLVSFVFFGAGIGGSLTTAMLVLMKLLKTQLQASSLYELVSILSWMLTVNTYISTMFGSLYMLWWANDLYAYWGTLCFLPLFLSGFEFYLQWRWALRFQSIADDLGVKAGKNNTPKGSGFGIPLVGNVNGKTLGLNFILMTWIFSYFIVYVRAIERAFPGVIMVM
jgi:hypothetical protein